jgi:hypothetical protein
MNIIERAFEVSALVDVIIQLFGRSKKGVILRLSKYAGKGLYAYASTSSARPMLV